MKNQKELLALTKTLNEQVLECEKTMRKIASLARESEDHSTKYYALTELSTKHFGLNALPQSVENLENYLKTKG